LNQTRDPNWEIRKFRALNELVDVAKEVDSYVFYQPAVSYLLILSKEENLTGSFRPVPTTLSRSLTTSQAPAKCPSFLIPTKDKSYKHQYANIYFIRLRILRQFVEERAKKRWKHIAGMSCAHGALRGNA
jgi:hypothetical protein